MWMFVVDVECGFLEMGGVFCVPMHVCVCVFCFFFFFSEE